MKNKSIWISALVIGILVLLFYTSDLDYLMLRQFQERNKTKGDIKIEKVEMLGEATTVVDDSLNEINYEYGTDSGHDTMLAYMMSEGYVKDLFTLYADSEQGTFNDLSIHVSATTLLGMQINETGLYDGTSIPKSYLPYKNGKVIWNQAYNGLTAEQMTLRNIGAEERPFLDNNKLDNSDGTVIGIFQYERKTFSNLTAKAKVNSLKNANRTKGNEYFLPDVLTWIDQRYIDTLKSLTIALDAELDPLVASSIISTAHNRGEGALPLVIHGIAYNSNGGSSNFIDKSKYTQEQSIKNASSIVDMVKDYLKDKTDEDIKVFKKHFGSDKGRMIAVCLGIKNGWYFSQNAYDRIGSKNGYYEVWNDMYPEDKVANLTEFKKLVKARVVTSLASVITQVSGKTVTSSDTKKVYNTATAYDDSPYNSNQRTDAKYGTMFKVYKGTSNVYKFKYANGSTPNRVVAYDIVSAGHTVSASFIGSVMWDMYTSMYKTNYSVKGFKTYGLPVDGYSKDQAGILNAALNYIGVPYEWGGYSKTGLDCSGLVSMAYKDAGISTTGRYTTEGLINSKNWKWIPYSEVKPGDIAVRYKGIGASGTAGGHTFIIANINAKEDKVHIIEAKKAGYPVHVEVRTLSKFYLNDETPTNLKDNKYYFYRYVGQ